MKNILIIVISIFSFAIVDTHAKDTAQSTVVMDLDSGRVLYEKNAHEKRLIASTTKIMTAILTIENTNINKTVTVGEEILKMYGTNIYIEVGEKMKVKDLLYGLLLRSGNDSATVLAKHVGGTEENFVKMMNAKSRLLGMMDTTFSNPHGLDDDTENYSTAYDMALLSTYANSSNTYREISKTKKYTTNTKNKSYLWYNRNKLLSTYEYCTGGKNGYTPKAGRTLVTTASKNNQNLTIVTLNDPNEYDTHKSLYDNIFSEYKNYTIVDKDKFEISKELYQADVYIKESFIYPLTKSEKENVKTEVTMLKRKETTGRVGYITITLNKDVIGKLDIYQKKQKKEELSLFSKIKQLFS